MLFRSRQDERRYYLNGKLVAKNRNKRMNQVTDSFTEFRAANPDDVGSLRVLKGTAKYKDPKRILPGAIFLVNGKYMVLQGSTSSLSKKFLREVDGNLYSNPSQNYNISKRRI